MHHHRTAQTPRDRRSLRLLAWESYRFIVFEVVAVVLATGGIGKSFKVTSNSWEYTETARVGTGPLINMEFVHHPTGMVAAQRQG